MRLTPYIAFRHLFTRLRSTLLTALGVALGVMVMTVMASLLLGLQQQFVDNLIATAPQINVEGINVGQPRREVAAPAPAGGVVSLSRRRPPEQASGITNYQTIIQRIEQVPGVVAASPTLSGAVLISYGTRVSTAALTGIQPRKQARTIAWSSRLREEHGSLETTANGVVVGIQLAKNLGIPPGAYVTIVASPERRQRMRVTALYDSGIRDIDETVVYSNLAMAQTLLAQPSEVSNIAIRVEDVNRAPQIAALVQSATGLQAKSWQEESATFFSIFRLQNIITSSIVAFIVIIAGFGITNGLITMILEKQREIGILKALGATADKIAAIFLLEGIVMGVIGALIGMGLAHVGINYLAHLPIQGQGRLTTASTFTMLRTPAIYLIPALLAVTISILASLLPVRRAAGYDPVEIIRSAK